MSNPTRSLILTFKDELSYSKYKQLVTDRGGTITRDYGTTALGFAATLPEEAALSFQTDSLVGDTGITSLELDQVVTTQQQ